MARGMVVPTQSRACFIRIVCPALSQSKWNNPTIIPVVPSSTWLLRCKCSSYSSVRQQEREPLDMSQYMKAFSRRMTLAGLKPHHRIALGVSGGPDSMALCLLTAAWKTCGSIPVGKTGGFIDGLLAIIVDHGLRAESKEEAHVVSCRVSELGIRCEIVHGNWSKGRPKQGHLQEAAREMRYQIFQNVCIHHQIPVLLIAHHADDQAELFIIRLSRHSGVLGLAGMAFTSQIFPSITRLCGEGFKNEGILMVRPLLDFAKADMYKICQGGGLDWVEDPTNCSPLYARNRIRLALGNLSSDVFQSEMQAIIAACRRTRTFVDQVCHNLINQTVTIKDEGYAIIDLETLDPSKITDICLSKFVALVLQFISQRHRPVRGSTTELLLDYFRTFPCKTSLTAAGCYLCPAPGCRGTKVLVCCSVNCPFPSNRELIYMHHIGVQKQWITNELEQIIADGKSCPDDVVLEALNVYFLDITSESLLSEAKRLKIISESTYENILLLQSNEIKRFKSKTEDKVDYKSKNEVEYTVASLSEPLKHGQTCCFMDRFLVTWKQSKNDVTAVSKEAYCGTDLDAEILSSRCCSCGIEQDMIIKLRHMIESDWLYLAKLSKCPGLNNTHQQGVHEQISEQRNLNADHLRLSAERALQRLKSIPVAARRSLPVLVNQQGLLLSVPIIDFKHCPCLMVSCVFKPRVPLGGGHSSFL